MISSQAATMRMGGDLLLTGAAGQLGRVLTQPLADLCGEAQPFRALRLSDRAPLAAGEHGVGRFKSADLADAAAVRELLQGVSAVVHMGGVSMEGPFEPICDANIRGVFHLYEACRLNGCRRVVFASSNHVTGGHPREAHLEPTDPFRPDGYYGASKLFGEGLASMYFDRYGIETVCLRLGSVTREPEDARALSTWLSHPDLVRLVHAALLAPEVGCTTVYGVSNNPGRWWGTQGWARIGYQPQDSSSAWGDRVGSKRFEPGSAMERLQGGSFLGIGPFDPVQRTPD
jgi:uronate dehydrogenase